MEKRFTVIKDEDVMKYLNIKGQEALNGILETIADARSMDNKKCENKYLVINTDEPYADLVKALILGKATEDYKPGINRSIEIIKKEMEFSKTVNLQMAMGMSQILNLLEKELKEQ